MQRPFPVNGIDEVIPWGFIITLNLQLTSILSSLFIPSIKFIIKYSEVEKIIGRLKADLDKNLGTLQLKHRHSAINPDSFLLKIDKAISSFRENLKELKDNQPDISDQDLIREKLDSILTGKVGLPLSSKELTAVYTEGKIRYENKIPPGYSDQKTGVYTYKGLELQRKYGDLIIWIQIINRVKDRQIPFLIFVTDDDKEDWWWIHSGKTIGPRPELIEEIAEKGSVKTFYMYTSSRFLEYAKKFLGVEIKQESINQVGEIQKITALGEFVQLWRMLDKAMNEINERYFPHKNFRTVLDAFKHLTDLNYFSDDEISIFQKLRHFRNALLHGSGNPSAEDLNNHIAQLKKFLARIEQFEKEKYQIQEQKELKPERD